MIAFGSSHFQFHRNAIDEEERFLRSHGIVRSGWDRCRLAMNAESSLLPWCSAAVIPDDRKRMHGNIRPTRWMETNETEICPHRISRPRAWTDASATGQRSSFFFVLFFFLSAFSTAQETNEDCAATNVDPTTEHSIRYRRQERRDVGSSRRSTLSDVEVSRCHLSKSLLFLRPFKRSLSSIWFSWRKNPSVCPTLSFSHSSTLRTRWSNNWEATDSSERFSGGRRPQDANGRGINCEPVAE